MPCRCMKQATELQMPHLAAFAELDLAKLTISHPPLHRSAAAQASAGAGFTVASKLCPYVYDIKALHDPASGHHTVLACSSNSTMPSMIQSYLAPAFSNATMPSMIQPYLAPALRFTESMQLSTTS